MRSSQLKRSKRDHLPVVRFVKLVRDPIFNNRKYHSSVLETIFLSFKMAAPVIEVRHWSSATLEDETFLPIFKKCNDPHEIITELIILKVSRGFGSSFALMVTRSGLLDHWILKPPDIDKSILIIVQNGRLDLVRPV
mgnify:CR=1 FL=1